MRTKSFVCGFFLFFSSKQTKNAYEVCASARQSRSCVASDGVRQAMVCGEIGVEELLQQQTRQANPTIWFFVLVYDNVNRLNM